MFTKGSSNRRGSNVDLLLKYEIGFVITVSTRFEFLATNNKDEYEAFTISFTLAAKMVAKNVKLWTDAQLVV